MSIGYQERSMSTEELHDVSRGIYEDVAKAVSGKPALSIVAALSSLLADITQDMDESKEWLLNCISNMFDGLADHKSKETKNEH